MMLWSPPNLVRQYEWPSTSTASAPWSSSVGTNVRPMSGFTPSTSKKLGDTTPVATLSGSPRRSKSKLI